VLTERGGGGGARPQAFSHFTYVVSGGRYLVVDIQGVGDVYTDPQIHSLDGKGFGLGNYGQQVPPAPSLTTLRPEGPGRGLNAHSVTSCGTPGYFFFLRSASTLLLVESCWNECRDLWRPIECPQTIYLEDPPLQRQFVSRLQSTSRLIFRMCVDGFPCPSAPRSASGGLSVPHYPDPPGPGAGDGRVLQVPPVQLPLPVPRAALPAMPRPAPHRVCGEWGGGGCPSPIHIDAYRPTSG